ncbi:orotidine-5'-phosphate decarboxylase [Patescibacteria group bacterium]|nr:orotidine-5'-phosphate decarboxylase [Patescibacteria group bacterium]MBU4367353.1 orotidine-5'-phosphate decarboxylase [Patescibacteria group bacterium]MBU4461973.1 orotidine-5'-phosphate decarboxylase [Patescibacteria group bacterium]MCG2699653.1 orotidine-5'-phosphate decarboxylase [Candidatus Parcubacteria bacterium]
MPEINWLERRKAMTVVNGVEPKDRIIVALDVSDVDQAISLVKLLKGHVGMFKIGLEFIWSTMANLLLLPEKEDILLLKKIRYLAGLIGGLKAFIDGKLCDIPNTLMGASIAISQLGVKFFNVHASAGSEAIKQVVANKGNSLVLAVTALTSLSEQDTKMIHGLPPLPLAMRLARIAQDAGVDGIICSPQEIEAMRKDEQLRRLLLVTPGVRPEWAVIGDQKRVMTPTEAIVAGADYLVTGRPITKPPVEIGGSVEAAKRIAEEIAEALHIKKRLGKDQT